MRNRKQQKEAKGSKHAPTTKEIPDSKEKSPAEAKSIGGRIIARVFNPLIKDVLIITAENVKK